MPIEGMRPFIHGGIPTGTNKQNGFKLGYGRGCIFHKYNLNEYVSNHTAGSYCTKEIRESENKCDADGTGNAASTIDSQNLGNDTNIKLVQFWRNSDGMKQHIYSRFQSY